jgi:hypothetical protein
MLIVGYIQSFCIQIVNKKMEMRTRALDTGVLILPSIAVGRTPYYREAGRRKYARHKE